MAEREPAGLLLGEAYKAVAQDMAAELAGALGMSASPSRMRQFGCDPKVEWVKVVGMDRRKVACHQTREWQLLKLTEQAYLAARRAVRAAAGGGRFDAGAWGHGLLSKCRGTKAEPWAARLGRWQAASVEPSLEDYEAFGEDLCSVQAAAEAARQGALAARSASWRAWVDQALAGGASQGHRYVRGQVRWGCGTASVVGRPPWLLGAWRPATDARAAHGGVG